MKSSAGGLCRNGPLAVIGLGHVRLAAIVALSHKKTLVLRSLAAWSRVQMMSGAEGAAVATNLLETALVDPLRLSPDFRFCIALTTCPPRSGPEQVQYRQSWRWQG